MTSRLRSIRIDGVMASSRWWMGVKLETIPRIHDKYVDMIHTDGNENLYVPCSQQLYASPIGERKHGLLAPQAENNFE